MSSNQGPGLWYANPLTFDANAGAAVGDLVMDRSQTSRRVGVVRKGSGTLYVELFAPIVAVSLASSAGSTGVRRLTATVLDAGGAPLADAVVLIGVQSNNTISGAVAGPSGTILSAVVAGNAALILMQTGGNTAVVDVTGTGGATGNATACVQAPGPATGAAAPWTFS